jgi:hypothetical protein
MVMLPGCGHITQEASAIAAPITRSISTATEPSG